MESNTAFTGSIPDNYDKNLGPVIFADYAADMARLVAASGAKNVLEIAAGTGIATRRLRDLLPADARLTASDLNPPMLEIARAKFKPGESVDFQTADGCALPFEDGAFDAVVCQFGVMFFPDKAKAFAEARRVLSAGGVFVFNVWDRIEENEFADVATQALASLFPEDPPRFMARVPHGYHDRALISQHLEEGGFTATPEFDTVAARSRASSAKIPAIAYCQGTPLRNEIEARGASRLGEATNVAEKALAGRFGAGAVDGKIQAHIVTLFR